MEEVNPNNNYIAQNLSSQRHCSKKKFMIPLLVIRGVALILCIIQYAYQVTNLKIYEEFEEQNEQMNSNVYNPYNSYNKYNFNEIVDLKKEENEMVLLNLIPTIILFILAGFLFLHFWCGVEKNCLSECHILINCVFNIFVGFIAIVGSLIDCFVTRNNIDKYNEFFVDSDFQARNKMNKIIDIFLFVMVISSFILLIIILCYLNREDGLCNMKFRIKCCELCYLCEIDCCHLCTCCDIPPENDISNNSLNNQPYNQQQNVLVVQQYGIPMNNNIHNADNTVYSEINSKKTKISNYHNQMPSSTDKIQAGKKKLTNSKKKKKNVTKNKSCIMDKYNSNYNNINLCTICNTNFKNGENILILPCEHIFHHNCVNNWFKNNNNICPIDGTQTN